MKNNANSLGAGTHHVFVVVVEAFGLEHLLFSLKSF